MTASATADGADLASSGAPAEMSKIRAWLAISAGTLGGFMALLDTSIVNASLPVIQGEIGATPSEATWIGTAYLMAEIIVLPLTAWIERMLGMRRFLFMSAMFFTGFSVLCGTATDLTTMIVGRLGQGFSGGMMMPTAYSLVGRLLPAEEQSKGIAIISAPILAGPIVGPLVGGWLTEHLSWHYAFFINVPICAVLLALLFAGIANEKMNLREITDADWFGVAGMTLFLGCLTVMLEEGHREQWFDSQLIWRLAGGIVIGFVLIVIGQLRPGRPILKLALVRDRTIFATMIILLVVGIVMYCILFLVPQFLVTVRDYSALEAGKVLFTSGVASVSMMFVYPFVMKYCDLRLMVFFGMLVLALACYVTSSLTAETDGIYFLWMQILMGSSLTLVAIPLQQLCISIVSVRDIPEITSLVTIWRNLGGSIGLAALASFREQRIDFHHWRIYEEVDANDLEIWRTISETAAGFGGGPEGYDAALRMLDMSVNLDAVVMTFNDAFFALTVTSILVAPLGFLVRARLPEGATATAAAH